MNRVEHSLVGSLVGAGAYLISTKCTGEQPTLGGLICFAAAGAVASAVPDVLEPAVHPNHRSFFHSALLNAALTLGACKLWQDPNLLPQQRHLLAAISLAYVSHPVTDATTPKGIPLIN